MYDNHFYEYKYVDCNGVSCYGEMRLTNDSDAVQYFRSLEENGGIRVKSLKNPQGFGIWNGDAVLNRKWIAGKM